MIFHMPPRSMDKTQRTSDLNRLKRLQQEPAQTDCQRPDAKESISAGGRVVWVDENHVTPHHQYWHSVSESVSRSVMSDSVTARKVVRL